MGKAERAKIPERLREIGKYWGTFPNITINGQYDFYTHVVSLDALESAHVNKQLGEASDLDRYRHVIETTSLAAHEYTHWLDANCTVFGLRLLGKLARSHETNPHSRKIRSKGESAFNFTKHAAEAIQHLKLPDYYSTMEKTPASRPWKYTITAGHGFDEHGHPNSDAIAFLKFEDANSSMVARQPLSVAAILESHATYEEIWQVFSRLDGIKDSAERRIEESLQLRNVVANLYDPQLTVYSVAAHLLASVVPTSSPVTAYSAASLLARYVLNCPSQLLRNFQCPAAARTKLLTGDLIRRFDVAINNGHIENLYFILAVLMAWDDSLGPQELFEKLSKEFFHIDLKAFENAMREEIGHHVQQISSSQYPYAKEWTVAAESNLWSVWMSQNRFISFDDLHLPACVLGDGELAHPLGLNTTKTALHNIPIEELFNELSDHEHWVRTFSEACYPARNLLA